MDTQKLKLNTFLFFFKGCFLCLFVFVLVYCFGFAEELLIHAVSLSLLWFYLGEAVGLKKLAISA